MWVSKLKTIIIIGILLTTNNIPKNSVLTPLPPITIPNPTPVSPS